MRKKYLIAALVLVFLLAGSLLWLASRPWENQFFRPPRQIRPAITIEQSLVTFWDQGKKMGSFRSDKIAIGKNDQRYLLTGVRDGRIFDQGRPVVSDLAAQAMTATPGQMDFQAREDISGLASFDDETMSFTAGQADYRDGPKEAALSRGFSCSFSDARIAGQTARIDLDGKTADSPGSFSLSKGGLSLSGQSFGADFAAKTLSVGGPVRGDFVSAQAKEKPLKTSLSFDSAVFHWRDKKALLTGHIKVIQAENTLLAEAGEYDETAQTLTLTKNVVADTSQGQTKSASAVIGLAEKNIQLAGQVQADLKIKIRR